MTDQSEHLLLQKLSSYTNNEKKPGGPFEGYSLEGISSALEILGNPQRRFPSVHIAGTNGKGSVCHMLSGILSGSGLKTGLYTSPHLVSVTERISIDGVPVSHDMLIKTVDQIESALSGKPVHLTYFDLLTVCAFIIFADAGIEIAVIETGLGGRLDSTNVLIPVLSIITDISLDHTHILGTTIPEITQDKASIIKKHIPCITTNTDPGAVSVLQSAAAKMESSLLCFSREFTAEAVRSVPAGIIFDYSDEAASLRDLELSLSGQFQSKNCSAVIKACQLLSEKFSSITEDSIRTALGKVSVPGRMQLLSGQPEIMFDPAHNRQAVESLFRTVTEKFPDRSILWVISFMADKEPYVLTEILRSMGSGNIIYCSLDDPRAHQPAPGDFKRIISSEDICALADAVRGHTGLTVFTGTFRLYETAVKTARLLLDSRNGSAAQ